MKSRRCRHVPVTVSTCDPGGWHDYGPWSAPYQAWSPGRFRGWWQQRRCTIPGCRAGEWRLAADQSATPTEPKWAAR